MKAVKPLVIKIGETVVDSNALREVMNVIGVTDAGRDRFLTTHGTDGQTLVEFAGRICYESYEPGLNPNVTRIREDPSDYFKNILIRGDGSILEPSYLSFAVFTLSRASRHEIVRHRVRTAVS